MRFPPFSTLLGRARVAMASRWPYAWGLAAGFGFAIHVLGWDFLSGDRETVGLVAGDTAAGLAAFRVFVADSWSWPILYTSSFGDAGVNIAFSDSIPLLAVVAKIARPLGIGAETWWALWFWLVYGLQGMSSIFAVRSWGGRTPAVQVAAPVVALLMPVLLIQSLHPSLSAHFIILFAWGLVGRMRAEVTSNRLRHTSALLLIALAVHPYLLAMVLILLAGAVADAVIQGRLDVVRAARWAAATAAGIATWMVTGGYLGSVGPSEGGFGLYATAITGPIQPVLSDLIGQDPDRPGIYPSQPGFSFLGVGLVVLGAVALFANRHHLGRLAVAHQGILLALTMLFVWAVSPFVRVWGGTPIDIPLQLSFRLGSFRAGGIAASIVGLAAAIVAVGLGWRLRRRALAPVLAMAGMVVLVASIIGLLRPDIAATLTSQFRASGRFVWPVLYAVPVLGLAGLEPSRLARSLDGDTSGAPRRRVGRPALLSFCCIAAVVALQIADTATARAQTRALLIPGGDARQEYLANLSAVIGAHGKVRLSPDFRCTYYPDGVVAFIDVTSIASATARDIDRIYSARSERQDECSIPQYPDLSDPDSVVIMIEPVSLVHDENHDELIEDRCRKWETINVCSHRWHELDPQLASFFGPIDD